VSATIARLGSDLALRLTKVDELILGTGHHFHLSPGDECFFLGEYTARAGYSFSDTNQLIINFKMGTEHRGSPRWSHKESAIRTVGRHFRTVLNSPQNSALLGAATLVPMPPSRATGDPGYDDRVSRMLYEIDLSLGLDIRELVIQPQSSESFHGSPTRPNPETLASQLVVNEDVANPTPNAIWVFDDVLVTGCHFKAVKALLGRRFPGVPIYGFFIARRVPDTDPTFGFPASRTLP
jgi:hypothetical protein